MFSVFDDLVELKKMLFLLISPFIEIDREEKTKLFRKNTDFLRRIKTLDWCITLNLMMSYIILSLYYEGGCCGSCAFHKGHLDEDESRCGDGATFEKYISLGSEHCTR